MRTRPIRLSLAATAATAVLLVPASAAQADDHLANASTSSGVAARGFANPVAMNPSGVSGAAAQPATVPGLGSPNAGLDTGTPSFSSEALCDRTSQRSAGTPAFC